MHQLWIEQGMKGLLEYLVTAYVSDLLLNETPLQNSTASVGDMPNVKVKDNEINIRIAEHDVKQEEELGVENETAHVTEAIVNDEGIDIVIIKKGARQVNAEERLVLKDLGKFLKQKYMVTFHL